MQFSGYILGMCIIWVSVGGCEDACLCTCTVCGDWGGVTGVRITFGI